VKLVVTGGGTGGHVFPALEVARHAREAGDDILYLGSLRGQERAACSRVGLAFRGFPSEPVYSVKSPKGWKALINLARATLQARAVLKSGQPDAVFSTGGYSSAPVVRAAAMLGIPFVLHEQNAVPGRSNLLSARKAFAIATTFHAAASHFEGCRVERTGLPIRDELRQAALTRGLTMDAYPMRVLVVGGSQGAAAVNEASLQAATRMTKDLRWLHVTGKKHFETMFSTYEKLGLASIYEVKAFLEGPEMAAAYQEASVVVGRSGAGTLSELAAFGLPSVLVPYPTSHANHQYFNAKEFADMGAAAIIPQEDLQAARLEEVLLTWLESNSARDSAREALATWDRPDAAAAIYSLLTSAASD
jgi:UDP-N-acetylglucosamine--N-acetylmuramyl-(pentapeptide) pyrophosphoryl-undecaprenol N-acetylglucosamine transferase